MALASYSDLVTEVGNWLNRSDLSAEIPTFVRLFEARMNRKLRTPDQELTSTITIIANQATYPVPAAIRQIKRITTALTGLTLTPVLGGTFANTLNVSGIPEFYSIDGTTFTLMPVPDGVNSPATVTVVGYNTLPALDGVTNTTNWLFASHPDAYLYGTLTEAAAFIRDDVHLPLWRAALDDVLEEVLQEANQRKVPMGQLRTTPAVFE